MTLRSYYGTEGIPVSRSSLSTATQDNLNKLEELGFLFSDTAFKMPVWGRNAHSILIPGTIDEHTVDFERRETRSRSTGQTYVWVDGKQYRLLHVLNDLIAGKPLGEVPTYYQYRKQRRKYYD